MGLVTISKFSLIKSNVLKILYLVTWIRNNIKFATQILRFNQTLCNSTNVAELDFLRKVEN